MNPGGNGPDTQTGADLVLVPDAEGTPAIHPRNPGEDLVIGRDATCDLVLDDAAVSRQHARIAWQDGVWWVVDQNSANGVRLDGAPVTQAALMAGTRLEIGPFRYKVDLRARRQWSWPGSGLLIWRLQGDDSRVANINRMLLSRQSVLGRGSTADVTLPFEQVSGLHARLSYRTSGMLVTDLGSGNGTRLNGQPVRQAVVHHGDRIEIADIPFRLRRTWLPGPLMGAGLAAVLALLLVLTLMPTAGRRTLDQERWWTRDMYLEEAERSLVTAVEAWERPEPARDLAKASFDIALRSLAAVDFLPPDQPTRGDVAAALSRAEFEFGGELAGRDLAAVLQAVEAPPAPAAVAEEAPAEAPFDLDRELSLIMAEFGIDTDLRPVPPDLVAEIDRYIEFWTVEKRGFTRRSWNRGKPHLPVIVEALRRHRLPEIFCYLPFIESGYRTEAVSSAGAGGLWQFMPRTARGYDLRVDDEVDERTDVAKATEAACQYLQYLLNAYGANSFMCAVAAYNKGEHGMLRCLGQGADWRSQWKFWDIATRGDGCLKPETIAYVPKFLAAAVVLRRPDVFSLEESS